MFRQGSFDPPPAALCQIPAAIIPAYLKWILNAASEYTVNMQGSASWLIMFVRFGDFLISKLSLYYFLLPLLSPQGGPKDHPKPPQEHPRALQTSKTASSNTEEPSREVFGAVSKRF